MTKKELQKWLVNLKYDIGNSQHQELWHYEKAIDRVIEALSEPEIIRCKDCKHLEIDKIYHDCWCDGKKVFIDHYCGYAERRTDG